MNIKSFQLLIACCTIAAVCTCCSSDAAEEPSATDGNTVDVEIETTVQTRVDVVRQFGNGDRMNVFAKTYNKVDAPDLFEDIVGTYRSGRWSTSPAIKLKEGERTFIYAFSPYREGVTDLAAIPVDIAEQEDLLYSGNPVPVSYTTHLAKLTMKHALALLAFNISKQGYDGKGRLQSLSVSGEEVYTTGKMNIETGKIQVMGKKTFVMDMDKVLADNGWTEDLPRMWNIPFTTKGCAALLTAVIDGKTYQSKFPEIDMKMGYQYVFRLILTNWGLEFIPNQTETVSLNNDTDEMESLEGHGILRIRHSGDRFTLPLLNGDNVFGSVDWGDEEKGSYESWGMHNYSRDTSYETVIESWNSTGFVMKNIVGVDRIDVSLY